MKLKFDRTTVFWTALISGLLLFGQQVATIFGFVITDALVSKILTAAGTLMSLLVLVGILTNSDEAEKIESKVKKK